MSSTGSSAPIDTNVKIPPAVLRNSAAADDIHKRAYAPTAPVDGAPPVDLTAAPASAPASAPAPETAPAGEDSWENRYKAMKGRHDRDQDTIRQQQQTITGLESRMSSMEGMLARQPAPAAPAPAEAPKTLVTDEDIATFGPDFMDVVGRVARQQFEPERQQLLGKINELQQQVGGVTSVVVGDAQQRMLARLDEVMPNWRAQNTDANFLAWLRLPDTYSGANRGELLKTAFSRNETDRVLAFFKGFLTEEATVAPAAASAPASDGRPSLADLAAPGRARSEAAPQGSSPEKPIISRAQIAQFYADVRAQKYKGRDDEKKQLEDMIFSAERDGRIR